MTAQTLMYFLTGLAMLMRTYHLIWGDWSRPLRHGPGFFLAFEVPPSFYDGVGAAWFGGFRAVLVTEYATEWIALVALVSTGQWRWLPFWAGGVALLHVASQALFGLAAGRALGRASTQPAVALSFEVRRVRDHLSWSTETAMAALLAGGWSWLLVLGDADVRWLAPAVCTYVVVALLVAKVVVIRAGAPLPADRAEEHHSYLQAARRQHLGVIDAARWFFVLVFAGYAVLHGGLDSETTAWIRWLCIAVAMSTWLVLVTRIVGGARRLDAMGRDLPPPGRAGPFRKSTWTVRGGGIWAVSFVVGLAVLFTIFGLEEAALP